MATMVIQGGTPLMEVGGGELWKVADLGPLRPRVSPGSMLDRVASGRGGYVVVQDREGARSGVPVEARIATSDEIAAWSAAASKRNQELREQASTPITAPDLMATARGLCAKAGWVRLVAVDLLVAETTLSRSKAAELVDQVFDEVALARDKG